MFIVSQKDKKLRVGGRKKKRKKGILIPYLMAFN